MTDEINPEERSAMKGGIKAALIAASAVVIAAIIELVNPGVVCELTGLGCPNTELAVEWQAWRYANGDPNSATSSFAPSIKYPKEVFYPIPKNGESTNTLYADNTVTFQIVISSNGSYKGLIIDNSRETPGELVASSDFKTRDVRVDHDPGDIFLKIDKAK